jgi:hypothetical protein
LAAFVADLKELAPIRRRLGGGASGLGMFEGLDLGSLASNLTGLAQLGVSAFGIWQGYNAKKKQQAAAQQQQMLQSYQQMQEAQQAAALARQQAIEQARQQAEANRGPVDVESGLPWGWIALGGGVLVLGTVALLLLRR